MPRRRSAIPFDRRSHLHHLPQKRPSTDYTAGSGRDPETRGKDIFKNIIIRTHYPQDNTHNSIITRKISSSRMEQGDFLASSAEKDIRAACWFMRPSRQHYKFTKHSPQTPNSKPTTFLMLSFSLNTKTEPTHTKMIPSPLNNGKSTTDGTLPAIFVITILIMDNETALPIEQISTAFLLFLSMFLDFAKKHKIKKSNDKRIKIVCTYALPSKI